MEWNPSTPAFLGGLVVKFDRGTDLARRTKHHVPCQACDLACPQPGLDGKQDEDLVPVRRCPCLKKDAERSSRNLCSAGCAAFMGLLSDISVFAPYNPRQRAGDNLASDVVSVGRLTLTRLSRLVF
jgi:hypothetical protein